MSRKEECRAIYRDHVGKMGYNMLSPNPNYESYKATLEHPFDVYGVKVPTGYPVKSSTICKHNMFPVSVIESSPGTYTINVAGTNTNVSTPTPIAFGFQPTFYFDATSNLQVSFAGQSPAAYLFTTWSNVMVSNSWSSNFSQYRVVSAGMRYRYTGAPLYASGNVSTNVTNLAAFNSYSMGASSNSTSRWYQDPDIKNHEITAPIEIVYTPADISCLEFNNIANDISDYVGNDWLAFLLVDNANWTEGFSFYIETVINYECVATASFDPISGGTEAADGNVVEVIEQAKEVSKLANGGPKLTTRPGTEKAFDMAKDIARDMYDTSRA